MSADEESDTTREQVDDVRHTLPAVLTSIPVWALTFWFGMIQIPLMWWSGSGPECIPDTPLPSAALFVGGPLSLIAVLIASILAMRRVHYVADEAYRANGLPTAILTWIGTTGLVIIVLLSCVVVFAAVFYPAVSAC